MQHQSLDLYANPALLYFLYLKKIRYVGVDCNRLYQDGDKPQSPCNKAMALRILKNAENFLTGQGSPQERRCAIELVNSSCVSDGISYLRVSDETLDDVGYNKWFPDKPDFLGHCGLLRSNSLLGNTYCDEKLLFICELNE